MTRDDLKRSARMRWKVAKILRKGFDPSLITVMFHQKQFRGRQWNDEDVEKWLRPPGESLSKDELIREQFLWGKAAKLLL